MASPQGDELKLTKPQLLGLALVTAVGYTVWGMLISLMPPFYPLEAEKKGATPKQYGFVFGIFNLAAVVSAPIFGKYGIRIGPRLLYIVGGFGQAISGILFSLLDYVDNVNLFIWLSYLIRAVAGIADAACWGAVLSILLKLFPKQVSKTVAFTETFFGLGFMLGPAIGSFLYNAGGFLLPYLTVGLAATVVAVGMVFVLPPLPVSNNNDAVGDGNRLGFKDALTSPTILLPFFDCFVCFFGNGLVDAMLQPFAEQKVGASVTQVGITFLLLGLAYTIMTPLAGYVCDKVPHAVIGALVGNVALVTAFTFLAPLPFIPMQPSLTAINVTCSLAGLGYAFINVSSFTRAQKAAVRLGYNKELETYIMISSLFASSLFLGNFVGPTLSGFLVENFGFPVASAVVWSFYCLVLVLDVVDLFYNVRRGGGRFAGEYESLD